MFDICLFDLDETLLRTDDIKEIREAGKHDGSPRYEELLRDALDDRFDRLIYDIDLLEKIRDRFPDMKLGVFTRSPRSYALTTLEWAYPGFVWDVVVAYEDVKKTKPSGEGIDVAMDAFDKLDVAFLPKTVLVGDNDTDVKAAYNCGCVSVLDKSAWPRSFTQPHWRAMGLVPDAIVDAPEQIIDFLLHPSDFLPALERAIATDGPKRRVARFDKINHFLPNAPEGSKVSFQVSVCGRSFAGYDSIKFRKVWHKLSEAIEEHKESDIFPIEWVETVRDFIVANFTPFMSPHVIVSTVPHRPGRKPRLEKFLMQLADSLAENRINGIKVTCEPGLLVYRDGVRSQHGDKLTAPERFANVRDFLDVQRSDLIQPKTAFIIIDDVVTTGASLIYSYKYLVDKGATDVRLLSFAKNISDILL